MQSCSFVSYNIFDTQRVSVFYETVPFENLYHLVHLSRFYQGRLKGFLNYAASFASSSLNNLHKI
jgi:hypothetical protein